MAQSQLAADTDFQSRTRACCTQQADTFKDDARADIAALATDILRLSGGPLGTFYTLNAAGPGIAEKVDNGDGTISQEKVTDGDLLSLTQAEWPTVAALYYAEDGSPKP
jgi:hypothetical protein